MTGLGSFYGLGVFCKAARILKHGCISQEAFMQSCWVFHWRLIITGDTPLALITSGLIILWERNVAFGRLLISSLSSEAVLGFQQSLTAVIQHFWIWNSHPDSSASQRSFWLSRLLDSWTNSMFFTLFFFALHQITVVIWIKPVWCGLKCEIQHHLHWLKLYFVYENIYFGYCPVSGLVEANFY